MSTVKVPLQAEPVQMPLFESFVDLPKLRAACEVIMGASRAPNTEAAYLYAWRAFAGWCVALPRVIFRAVPIRLLTIAAGIEAPPCCLRSKLQPVDRKPLQLGARENRLEDFPWGRLRSLLGGCASA